MAVPLLIAGAAISAAAGIAGAMSQASAAARQNAAIGELIKNQEKVYEVQKRARAAQYRDLAFNQMQVFDTRRMENRQRLLQSRIEDNVNRLASIAKRSEIEKAKFQSEQDYILNMQREAQAALKDMSKATASQAKEAEAALKQVDNKDIKEARTQLTKDTQSDFAKQNRLDLAEQNLQAEKTGVVNRVLDEIRDTRQIADQSILANTKLYELQDEMNQTALQNQLLQEEMALGMQNDYNKLNRELIKSENQAFNLAAKANFLAERIKLDTLRKTDKLQYKSAVSQLKAGMVNADIMPTVLGSIGQLAGSLAGSGIFNRPTSVPSPVTTPTVGMQHTFGLNQDTLNYINSPSSTISTPPPSVGSTISVRPPTVFGQQQSSSISTNPPINWGTPLTPSSRITTMPPSTFGLNQNTLNYVYGR